MFRKLMVSFIALLSLAMSCSVAVASDMPAAVTADITKAPFIVEDWLWETAKTYKYVYPTGYEVWGVAFSEIPVGTIVFTPFDGYGLLFFCQGASDKVEYIEVLLTSNPQKWEETPEELLPDEKIWYFTVEDCDFVADDSNWDWNFTVKKGEPMLRIDGNSELQEGVRLFIEPYLMEPDQENQDPIEYLRQTLGDE